MLWELFEYFRKKIVMTVIPSLRNLFSSLKGLTGMVVAMLVLQLLLSVICVTGIDNIANQQTVLKDFSALIASSNIETQTSAQAFGSEALATALSSTSIFIGAILVWGICALTVYQKITFASADRDKYVWGMYVTHGAKLKKIRGMLKCELYLPQLFATVIAYPLAIKLCNFALKDHGYSYSPSIFSALAVLVLSYICIRLVVEYECLLIRRMTPVELLKEEDSPKSICYPRRHSRIVMGFTPRRYAFNTFLRMRKYYISLAAIAAIPAVVWICLHVSAVSEDVMLTSNVEEFAVTVPNGIDEESLDKILDIELADVDGIHSIRASASYPASKIYTHLLLDSSNYTDTSLSPYLTDLHAENGLTLAVCNRAFRQRTGYDAGTVRSGYVTIVSPIGAAEYGYKKGDSLVIAVSKLDGSARLVTSELDALRSDMSSEWEYIELTVGDHCEVQPESLSEEGFVKINKTYFLLSTSDYERITSISSGSYSYTLPSSAIKSFSTALDAKGGFNITLNASDLKIMPTAGDCIEAIGQVSASFSLSEIGAKEKPDVWSKSFDESFTCLYVNSVTLNGSEVTLNVSPRLTVKAYEGLFWNVLLAFGTPEMTSGDRSYFASTCESNLTLSDTSVSLEGDEIRINTSSIISGAQAGTHALMSSEQLNGSTSAIRLESLYADNYFNVSCRDKLTSASLGIDIPHVNAGEAVLVIPSNALHHYAMQKGAKLRIAMTPYNVSEYDPNSITATSQYDMLQEHISSYKFKYVQCHILEIVYSDQVSEPYVFLSSDDFSKVIGKKAPYVSFGIVIDSDVDSNTYSEIRKELSEWSTSRAYHPTVQSTGEYLDHLLHRTANYSTVISIITLLIPLMIPFIWYYPLSTLHDRRKTELRMLQTIGKKRSQIRSAFVIEGATVSLLAFLTVLLLCWPTMLVFKFICQKCHLPLAFEYSNLSAEALLTAALFSALCCAVSFAIAYTCALPRRKKMKGVKKTNDS